MQAPPLRIFQLRYVRLSVKSAPDDRPRRDRPTRSLCGGAPVSSAGTRADETGTKLQYNSGVNANVDVVANLSDYGDLRFDGGNDQGIKR
jgi:hypothetical protein